MVAGDVRRHPRRGLVALLGVHAPAGEDAGGVLDVVLVVGADPDGVQLEQLAAQVLVRVLGGGVAVVEVDEHRRVRHGGEQDVLVPAEGLRAEGLAVRAAEEVCRLAVQRHVEVVLPELRHQLEDLTVGEDPAHQHVALVVLAHAEGAHHAHLVLGPHALRALVERRPPALELVGEAVRDRARGQLPLPPRARTTRGADLGRELRRDAVAEAGDQVLVARLEELLALVLGGLALAEGMDGRSREHDAGAGEAG